MKGIFGKALAILGVGLLLFATWGASPAHAGAAFISRGNDSVSTAATMQPVPLSVSAGFCSCYLYGVWGSGASDVYAVGYSNVTGGPYLPLVYHYDGTGWTAANLSLPDGWDFAYLSKVWGSGIGDVYAAGYGKATAGPHLPLLYHYDGHAWTSGSLSLPDGVEGYLLEVWGTGASDVYAAGFSNVQGNSLTFPLLYHYDGINWDSISLPLPAGWQSGSVGGVWGSSATDVYAAGSGLIDNWIGGIWYGRMPLIYHYDGSGWSTVSLPVPDGWSGGGDFFLEGVWGSGADDVHAAGYDGESPILYHYGGSNWTVLSPALPDGSNGAVLHGVWGTGASDVYAAGYDYPYTTNPPLPLLYHYGASSWTPVTLPLPAGWNGGLEGVWASSTNDVYAVGYSWDANGRKMPLIYHYGGTGWTFSLAWPTPTFSVTPASWDYGMVKVGTTCGMLDVGTSSACKVFTVKNTGPGDLIFSGNVTLTGAYPSQFQILDASCSPSTVLQQTGTCTVIVAFKPTHRGRKNALLLFRDNAAGSPHTIALSGTGGTEKALNGGFNAYLSSTAKIPSSWAASNFASADGKNTAYKTEGVASVKITGQVGKTKTLTQIQLISGAAGDAFQLSLWRKGMNIPATAGVVQAQILLYNGSTLKQNVLMPLPTGNYAFTWQRKTFTATYPYTKIVIKLAYSKATGAVWFDGLSLLRFP